MGARSISIPGVQTIGAVRDGGTQYICAQCGAEWFDPVAEHHKADCHTGKGRRLEVVCVLCKGSWIEGEPARHKIFCPDYRGELRLNLGCSDSHMKGWHNVDVCEPADQIADLDRPWPWITSSVQEIKAWDIFEHLPSKKFSMNEAHRVLIPGGKLDLFIPTTDGRGAFQDPTHQSFWTPNDLFYFVERYAEWQRFHKAYGITARFREIQVEHAEYPNKVWKLRAILEAVK